MKRLVLIWLILLSLGTGYALGDTLTQEVMNQLKPEQAKMFEAFCNGDAEAFKKLAGDDYLTINADGSYMNKNQTLDYIQKFKGATYKILEQTDRQYDNLVLSTGRAEFYMGSLLAADVYFTQGWIFRDNRWQFISWQGTTTGTPKNYPIYMTLITLAVVGALGFVVYRVRRKRERV